MPIPEGASTDGMGGGRYTRFGAPVFSGFYDNAAPGGVALVQSSGATSTSATRSNQLLSTAATNGAFFYVPQSTITLVPDGTAPPLVGIGAVFAWDSAQKTLMVYSTVTAAWMRPHQGTSSETGFAIVWSSS